MASKPPVSVFILSKNEEQKIGPALESVWWAAEIVVIDSFSTDMTVEIAQRHGAKVVQIAFKKFGELRQAGIDHTTQPWIFSLDCDERCTPEARDEILRIVADPGSADAYRVPRQNILLGRRSGTAAGIPTTASPSSSGGVSSTTPRTTSTRDGC